MATVQFAVDRKRDSRVFGILLMVTGFFVVLICFEEILIHYALLFILTGIATIIGFCYFFRVLGATPTFLVYKSPFEKEITPKLNKRTFIILGFMGLRLFVALLVYLGVEFVFVAIGITIIDLINSKIIILTGKSAFWDKMDNNLDIFARLFAVFSFIFLYWWIPIIIIVQFIIWVIREVDLKYTWLRTFPPDVIWLVYAVEISGVAMYIISIAIFVLNLLSYSLITGRNGVLLRPS